MLRKIEIFITPKRLDDLRDLLHKEGIEGMTVLEAKGFGVHSEKDRKGKPMIENRYKVEIVVDESIVEKVILHLKKFVIKHKMRFGRIFVLPVEDSIGVSMQEFEARSSS